MAKLHLDSSHDLSTTFEYCYRLSDVADNCTRHVVLDELYVLEADR